MISLASLLFAAPDVGHLVQGKYPQISGRVKVDYEKVTVQSIRKQWIILVANVGEL